MKTPIHAGNRVWRGLFLAAIAFLVAWNRTGISRIEDLSLDGISESFVESRAGRYAPGSDCPL